MASPVIIRVYASSESVARRAARAAYDRMHALEMTLSDWMPESESNRLEAAAPEAIQISDDLRHAITVSTALHHDTDGAFDPTIGPLVELWRRTRTTGEMPGSEEVRDARNRVDPTALELRGSTARIAREDVEIDFGAIGKGIALDAASEILDAHGLGTHLINFDGEILVGDAPPERTAWQITILPAGDEDTLVIDAVQACTASMTRVSSSPAGRIVICHAVLSGGASPTRISPSKLIRCVPSPCASRISLAASRAMPFPIAPKSISTSSRAIRAVLPRSSSAVGSTLFRASRTSSLPGISPVVLVLLQSSTSGPIVGSNAPSVS